MILRSWYQRALNPGLREAIRKVRVEIKIAAAHRKSVRRVARLPSTGLRLNCGCGRALKPGWINIDLASEAACSSICAGHSPLPMVQRR